MEYEGLWKRRVHEDSDMYLKKYESSSYDWDDMNVNFEDYIKDELIEQENSIIDDSEFHVEETSKGSNQ